MFTLCLLGESEEEEIKNILNAELVIDPLAGGLGEAAGLGLVVAVTKVVTVAGRLEGEVERVVGRVGAAVRGPDEVGRVLRIPVRSELGQRDAVQVLIRLGRLDGQSLAGLDGGALGRSSRQGHDGRSQGEKGGELHLRVLEAWGLVGELRDRLQLGYKRGKMAERLAFEILERDVDNRLDLYVFDFKFSLFLRLSYHHQDCRARGG